MIKKSVIVFVFIMLVSFSIFKYYRHHNVKKPLKHVTIRLQWVTQTQFAGFYVAKSKGFYKDYGLDVSIEEGGYALSNIRSVKEGAEEFGCRWASDLLPYYQDLIIIANIFKNNGLLLVSKKERNIKNIHNLIKKRLSIWFIGNELQLLSLLDKFHISNRQVEVIPQKFDLSQFYNDEVDAISAMSFNELLILNKNGYPNEKLNILDYKDYGYDFLGDCIFTSKSYLKNHPDVCQAFVQASIKGWEYSLEHPEEAAKIVVNQSKNMKLDYAHQLSQLNAVHKLIISNQYPIGFTPLKDIQKLIELFYKNGILTDEIVPDQIYTNQFIKKESRK